MRALLNKTTILALIASVSAGNSVLAQSGSLGNESFSSSTPSVHYDPPAYAPTSPVPPNFFSSTVHEGFFRGIASGMQASANLALALGQKAILDEQAQAMYYQNRVNNTATFYAREEIKREAFQSRKESEWLWDDLMEERKEEKARKLAVTKFRLPRTLFNSDTGEIFWPEVFQRPEFAALTHELDRLFEGLASEGPQHDYLYRDPIAVACGSLLEVIHDQRRTFGDDLEPYWQAVNLVTRLEYKADHWSLQDDEMGYRGSLSQQVASANLW